jgi:hypothetical protein
LPQVPSSIFILSFKSGWHRSADVTGGEAHVAGLRAPNEWSGIATQAPIRATKVANAGRRIRKRGGFDAAEVVRKETSRRRLMEWTLFECHV